MTSCSCRFTMTNDIPYWTVTCVLWEKDPEHRRMVVWFKLSESRPYSYQIDQY